MLQSSEHASCWRQEDTLNELLTALQHVNQNDVQKFRRELMLRRIWNCNRIKMKEMKGGMYVLPNLPDQDRLLLIAESDQAQSTEAQSDDRREADQRSLKFCSSNQK